MSMLAEPRRKTKWTLNPRGKIWTDDETKLGQKLLEKMGWSKGKGLGKKEQGDLDPIRLNYKNDSKGMGFKGSDDDWVQHRDEFNALLSQLNGSDTVAEEKDLSVAANGLERRSKTSRARVHYHKYVRNKDLSKYSAEDLACILGKRQNSKAETPQGSDQEEKEQDKPETDEDEESHTHGVTTIKRGNIHEYFAAKLAALQQKSNTEEEGDLSKEAKRRKSVTINEEMNLVKEFCSTRTVIEEFSNDSWAVEQAEELVAEVRKKPKKKKKKNCEEGAEPTAGQDSMIEQSESWETANGDGRKKRKRKAENGDSKDLVEQNSPHDDSLPTNEEVGDADEDRKEEKKKKKKKKKHPENDEATPTPAEGTEVTNDPVTDSRKKKKKNKVSDEVNDLPSESSSANEESTQYKETSESTENKKKKKKKKKRESDVSSTETETPSPEVVPAEPEGSDTVPEKKKKKKKDRQDYHSTSAAETIESTEDVTSKGSGKRKRQKETNLEDQDQATESRDVDTERVPEKKKRKKDPAEVDEEENTSSQTNETRGVSNSHGSLNGQPNDLSKKIKRKFQDADFNQFKGSNILEVKGYAYA